MGKIKQNVNKFTLYTNNKAYSSGKNKNGTYSIANNLKYHGYWWLIKKP